MKMKRVLAAAAAALVLAASAVCLTACGGDTNTNTDTGTGTGVVEQQLASLAGTKWDITGMTVDGKVMSIEEMEQLYGDDLEMYFSFSFLTIRIRTLLNRL